MNTSGAVAAELNRQRYQDAITMAQSCADEAEFHLRAARKAKAECRHWTEIAEMLMEEGP